MIKRIDWIDSLRGVGIYLVVLGHMSLPAMPEQWIYSFHMPLFFIISGYLFRSSKFDLDYVKRKFVGLMIPYFIFAVASAIISAVILKYGVLTSVLNIFYLNGTGWNTPIWFLPVLFLSTMIFAFAKSREINSYIVCLLFFILGYFISNTGTYPLGIDKIIYAVFFMAIGKILKDKQPNASRFPLIIVTSLVINIVFGLLLNDRVSIYRNEIGNYFYFIVAAIAGSLTVMFIFQFFNLNNKVFRFYGKNSLIIMGTHYFLLMIINKVFEKVGIQSLVKENLLIAFAESLLIMLVSVVIIYAYNKCISRFTS